MVIPFTAIYFTNLFGAQIAGVSTICNVIVAIIFSLVGGYYADVVGRKPMLLISELLCAVSYAIMALVISPWVHMEYLLLPATLLVNACWGLSKPASDAMLIDVTDDKVRKKLYQITYWTGNLSSSISGIVGAFIFSKYKLPLFGIIAFIFVISLFVTRFFISESLFPLKKKSDGERSSIIQFFKSVIMNYAQVFRDHVFMLYAVSSIFIVSMELNLTNYISVRLNHDMQNTTAGFIVDGYKMTGYLITLNTLVIVCLSLPISKMLKRNNDTFFMFSGLLAYVAGYSYMVVGINPIFLLIMMAIATFGEIIFMPIRQKMLINIIPNEKRSSYMAVNGLVFRLAMLFSGLFLIIGSYMSQWVMLIIITSVGILGISIIAIILPQLKGTSTKEESVFKM
jgi:DHA1 family multidrug resistance protein B-like MFS transporter